VKIFSTLNHLHALGATDGKERGAAAGASRQLGKLLLRHGKRLLGAPEPGRRAVVEDLIDRSAAPALEEAMRRLPEATSWEELLAGVSPPERPADPDYLMPYEFDPEPLAVSIDEYARVTKHSGEPMIFHIRFQRVYQENIGSILYRDSKRVQAEHHCPVETAVLLLWPGADGPAMTGEYEIPTGGTYRYHLTRLWEKDAEEMFDSISTAAFAPLAKFPPERLRDVVRRMGEVFDEQARDEETRANVWLVAYGSMGLRYTADQVHELLADRLPYLMKTDNVRTLISEGYYEAFTRGEAEGALSACRLWVTALGGSRLGEPPALVTRAVESTNHLDRLEQMAARVLKAADWQEVLAPN
jgi:hypothetical protein